MDVKDPSNASANLHVDAAGNLLTNILGIGNNPDVVTGNITAATAVPATVAGLTAASFQSIAGGTVDSLTIRINSIAGGAATGTVGFYGTDDGVNLYPISGLPVGGAIGSGSLAGSGAAAGAWQVKGSSVRTVYAIATAVGAGATINVSLSATPNQSRVTSILRGSLGGSVSAPAGTAPAEAVAVQTGARTVFTATIVNGASLSGAVDLGNCTASRLGTPATITGTGPITFQASHDGTTYKDLYDKDGFEYKINTTAASRTFALNVSDFLSIRYLKVRTGTSASPQAQGQDTAITITGLA